MDSLRIKYLKYLSFLLFLIIVLQLINLQVIRKKYFFSLSEGNRIKIIKEEAPRGVIFDRYGRKLVDNEISPTVSLILSKEEMGYFPKRKLAKILNIPEEEIHQKCFVVPSYYPVDLKEDLDLRTLTLLLEDFELPEVFISLKTKRKYYLPYASHFVGYVGKITPREFDLLKEDGYKITDRKGKTGVEYFYDNILRGKDGGSQVEVDASGRRIRTIGYQRPEEGADLYLTIDKDLQEICEEVMEGHMGAVVVMIPKSGEILALVSSPRPDIKLYQGKMSLLEWEKMVVDEKKPLQNRAISNKYPPGSVFKIITSVAAMEEEKVQGSTSFFCRGYIFSRKRRFRCWKRDGHKKVDFVSGIALSCDIVFYQLARLMGHKTICKWAENFNLGKKTGIDLPFETKGTLPSEEHKLKQFGKKWYEGDTLNLGIGQGFLEVSPLQMAVATSAIAAEGKLPRPYIVKKIKSFDKEINISPYVKNLSLRKETIDIITEGMIGTVNYGTGVLGRTSGMQIAGKTGTAEDPPREEPHSWFVSFAPADKPKIVVVVFVEQGGSGGEVAAPLARRIYEEGKERSRYFKENIKGGEL